MDDQIVVDHDYFHKEVTRWYENAEELAIRRNLYRNAELPELSDRVGYLSKLIPALNTAIDDMFHNLCLAVDASKTIAELLATTGKEYGLTEEEATALAEGCDTSD